MHAYARCISAAFRFYLQRVRRRIIYLVCYNLFVSCYKNARENIREGDDANHPKTRAARNRRDCTGRGVEADRGGAAAEREEDCPRKR